VVQVRLHPSDQDELDQEPGRVRIVKDCPGLGVGISFSHARKPTAAATGCVKPTGQKTKRTHPIRGAPVVNSKICESKTMRGQPLLRS
jgi:hypothetical protein